MEGQRRRAGAGRSRGAERGGERVFGSARRVPAFARTTAGVSGSNVCSRSARWRVARVSGVREFLHKHEGEIGVRDRWLTECLSEIATNGCRQDPRRDRSLARRWEERARTRGAGGNPRRGRSLPRACGPLRSRLRIRYESGGASGLELAAEKGRRGGAGGLPPRRVSGRFRPWLPEACQAVRLVSPFRPSSLAMAACAAASRAMGTR